MNRLAANALKLLALHVLAGVTLRILRNHSTKTETRKDYIDI